MIKTSVSIPLRYALIIILLSITFITGLTVTLVCLRQSLENRKDFAHAIGYQLSLNINQNLDRLINETEDFVNTTERIYKNTNSDGTNTKVFLHALADHLIENPRYGVIVYTEEKTGRTFVLDPPINKQFKYGPIHSSSKEEPDDTSTDADITLREYIPNPINGTLTKKKYLIENYPDKPFETVPGLHMSFTISLGISWGNHCLLNPKACGLKPLILKTPTILKNMALVFTALNPSSTKMEPSLQ